MSSRIAFLCSLAFACCCVACGSGSPPSHSTDPAILFVTITPTSVDLLTDQTQQFAASVTRTGNADKSVRWLVNDVAGGNATIGTINQGLYTAPTNLPGSPITIKAVSIADPSKSASAQITIRAPEIPRIVWPPTNVNNNTDNEGDSTETPPGIAIVDDKTGGAYVVWEHQYPTVGMRVQHLGPHAEAKWPAPGIPVTSSWIGWQASPRAVSDGDGGLIIIWADGRRTPGSCDVYGQRLDPNGNLLWGDGGKLIALGAGRPDLWMASDGAGGAILAFTGGSDIGIRSVQAQHINSQGDPIWAADGVEIVHSDPAGEYGRFSELQFESDGKGGLLAAWYVTSAYVSVRAQRISASGQRMWNMGGVLVAGLSQSDPNGSGAQTLDVVSDGAGGAIVVASRNNFDVPAVFAQRIDELGNVLWSHDGVLISSSTKTQLNPRALTDRAGGAFVTWQDCANWGSCDIAMQHINNSGETTWGAHQVVVVQIKNQQLAPVMQPNDRGGAVVIWTDCRDYDESADSTSCIANSDIYAQSVDDSGRLLWSLYGYPLAVGPGNQGQRYYSTISLPAAVSLQTDSGEILLAWPDGGNHTCFRGDSSSACQVFVERFGF